MIRVLSGKYKNRKLKFFKYASIRPTQSRVKKSLFDSINNFEDKKVLDLFCGVGTLGIEALSRGAKAVTFVDNNIKAINILKKNLELLAINNKNSIINCDVIKFLNKDVKKYDIILADPPYNKFSFIDFIPLITKKINSNGVFCYETSKKETLINLSLKVKKIGDTQLIFWRKDE